MTTLRRMRARFALAGLALGFAALSPAQAQFMSPYPAVIIVPPPAQSFAMPKKPRPPPSPPAAAPPDPSAPHELTCHYQGQTRVCE